MFLHTWETCFLSARSSSSLERIGLGRELDPPIQQESFGAARKEIKWNEEVSLGVEEGLALMSSGPGAGPALRKSLAPVCFPV